MNIKQFKEGDIITRVSPCEYGFNNIKDGSYIGDRMIFLGVDEKSKIILLNMPDSAGFKNEVLKLSYARDKWNEGWDYFPEKLWQKALQKIKKTN